MHNNPNLSIVVTTRNDNHGGDLLLRTQTFLNGLLHLTRKFSYHIELIIVEWNPPNDKPLLKDVLPIPKKDDFLTIKYIVVPSEIHNSYRMANRIPLFQMTAKNVGIRRAKGKFILCTNIDILFSESLFTRIISDQLNKNYFYRANRADIPDDVIKIESVDEQLLYASKNIIKVLGINKELRHIKYMPNFFYNFRYTMKLLDYIIGIYDKIFNRENYYFNNLDTVACGDFTLMSKENWLKISGYVELDMYSIHIDTMAIYAAYLLSIKQYIFPYKECIYHIHHYDGWESVSEPESKLKFLVNKPGVDWWHLAQTIKQMKKEGKTEYNLNKPDWGFANENFKEYIFEPGNPMQEIN